MSTQAVSMPSVQGEAMELFLRVSSPHVLSERPASRGSFTDNNAPRSSFGAQARPSTGVSRHGSSRVGVRAAEGLTGAKGFDAESITRSGLGMGKTAEGGTRVLRDSSVSNSKAQEGDMDVNETKSKLLGGYLRARLLDNINTKGPAKELVKRSFRHLHRGQGHVLTLEEFKEGLSNTFGALIPLRLIHATFDIFDTEPRTWQLDFDEFCHWLETGERSFTSHGMFHKPKPADSNMGGAPEARKPRSNDTSGDFQSSVKDPSGSGMSLEQADRAKLKAHLINHRTKLHKPNGLTNAQKSIVDRILLDEIRARKQTDFSTTGNIQALEEFKSFARGSDRITWHSFKTEISSMLPHLKDEHEVKEAFSRMDHNGDGVVDLTDFLMWQERMQEGKMNTDFWALREEEHLEQIKLARSKASNLLVPEDYDGSTHHAQLAREQNKKTLSDIEDFTGRDGAAQPATCIARNQMAQDLRDNILSQVKGGSLEMLRAFRHFRPAAVGRRLFIDYREFRESIKQKGLGLREEDIKSLFAYFDEDGSGEVDFSEFRRFLQGGIQQTGLEMGVNRHEEKTAAARQRVAALNSTALDPSLVGDARSDERLRGKVLQRIHGGQSEILRALRKFEKGGEMMAYPSFASAMDDAGFSLSESETKQIFNKFRLSGASGQHDIEGIPRGNAIGSAFREWLLESHTSTGLEMETSVGDVAIAAEKAAKRLTLVGLHKKLREKIIQSLASDRRNLLRAFRGSTRTKGSDVYIADFREAMDSFGMGGEKAAADQLFDLYDWRQLKRVNFQELLETITRSESLPKRITTSERRHRLEAEMKVSEQHVKKIENKLRRGLWKIHCDDAEACFTALVQGEAGASIGLPEMKAAARMTRAHGDENSDQVFNQILRRHAGLGGGQGVRAWTLRDFKRFYRADDCRKAMSAARERVGVEPDDAEAKRAAMIGEGNRARVQLVGQVRRLSDALRAIDRSHSGRVSRKIFAQALSRGGGLGKVGDAELTRLLIRHGCSEQGGSYVNYPAFVASFIAAVRGAAPASAVAAAAAATASTAMAAASVHSTSRADVPNGGSQSGSTMIPPVRTKQRNPGRSASETRVLVECSRPNSAAAGTGCSGGEGVYTYLLPKRASTPPAGGKVPKTNPLGETYAGNARARTTDGFRPTRKEGTANQVLVANQTGGYFKYVAANGGDMDCRSLLKGSKSAPALPNLVGQRPEMPKTTPLHRAMRKDVVNSMKALRKAFKKFENPYRRGVVSAKQFQAACRKNGVAVGNEDVEFLLRVHRHKPAMGGRYAIIPAWVQSTPSPTAAADRVADPGLAAAAGVRYEEFLRTCHAARDLSAVRVR